MRVLEVCEPNRVFYHFETISAIPRGSGNEKGVSDYIKNFALHLGLTVIQDENNNLVIKKPGTTGYETAPAVCLQGHLDMVCEKNRTSDHDFSKDPLSLYIEDGFVKARGTTLGGDNGIAVAYGMALLEATDIPHPPLEILLTTDEEVGMNGAAAVSPALFNAKTLINIDSEEEGIFYTSCAGGAKATVSIKGALSAPADNTAAHTLFVSGLKGGHSGMDIHKERGNSNMLLARALYALGQRFDFALESIGGGSKDNAIPREAEAVVWIKKDDTEAFYVQTKEIEKTLKHEFRMTDEGLTVSAAPAESASGGVFDKETLKNALALILLAPNGVTHMSADIPGLVETSNNLGVIRTEKDQILFTNAVRSSVISRKYALLDQITLLADICGGEVAVRGNYPAWEYQPQSEIRKIFLNTYSALYGKEAKVAAVHAGLECGIFSEKIKGVDMISFGPEMFDVHTPDERLSIASVERTWAFLLAVLAAMKG